MGDAFKVMNFVTEKELAELKDARGERVEDGTLAPDRPLFEILKENKEKKDAEFNERFRNLPPKALDDDEMEFLEAVDKHKRESDREAAQKEAQELANFQAAILARTVRVAPAKPGPVKPAGHGVSVSETRARREAVVAPPSLRSLGISSLAGHYPHRVGLAWRPQPLGKQDPSGQGDGANGVLCIRKQRSECRDSHLADVL